MQVSLELSASQININCIDREEEELNNQWITETKRWREGRYGKNGREYTASLLELCRYLFWNHNCSTIHNYTINNKNNSNIINNIKSQKYRNNQLQNFYNINHKVDKMFPAISPFWSNVTINWCILWVKTMQNRVRRKEIWRFHLQTRHGQTLIKRSSDIYKTLIEKFRGSLGINRICWKALLRNFGQ